MKVKSLYIVPKAILKKLINVCKTVWSRSMLLSLPLTQPHWSSCYSSSTSSMPWPQNSTVYSFRLQHTSLRIFYFVLMLLEVYVALVVKNLSANSQPIYRTVYVCALPAEKEMATHSSVPAWRIPGMGEPGGLPSMRSHRVGHD